ncbi:MAG: UvrB/UvrC motif-containing protein [Planctomycetaceae bacterium]
MKKCHRCQKTATLHITEIKHGDAQELHLCESCAQEYLKYADTEAEDAEGLAAKLAEVSGDQDLEEIDQLVCPNCGITFKEFRSQGRLGCPHDYIAFEDELLPLLENIHGETQHCGKFPKRAPDASRRQYQLIKLRNELRTAIEDEQYEAAAKLRDDIQQLETKLAQGEEEG